MYVIVYTLSDLIWKTSLKRWYLKSDLKEVKNWTQKLERQFQAERTVASKVLKREGILCAWGIAKRKGQSGWNGVREGRGVGAEVWVKKGRTHRVLSLIYLGVRHTPTEESHDWKRSIMVAVCRIHCCKAR